MKTKFPKLQLEKKVIANLNDEQLASVKGGNNAAADNCTVPTAITCVNKGSTVIHTKVS